MPQRRPGGVCVTWSRRPGLGLGRRWKRRVVTVSL